jgi:uncharacterized protein YjbI with pentapeptide repeats
MADEKQLVILKQGVEAWNSWREEHPSVRPNLAHAFLADADLDPFSRVTATCLGVDPADVDIICGTIVGPDLAGANLAGANLARTYLAGAILTDADFADAILFETIFGDVDLSTCRSLEACLHFGPSVVDIRTLQRSGPLPLAFLRGVGLPDTLIDYLPSLLNKAIQMYSCFISYSSKDEDFAQRLHADLQNKGVRCWFAPHHMPIGAKIWDAIDEAIRLRDKVLLILSKRSIASGWVEDEVTKAFAEERRRGQLVLFPVRLDNAVLTTAESWAARLRDSRNIGDFRRWKEHDAYTKALDRLLRDLRVKET